MRVTAWATAPAQAMPMAVQPLHMPQGRRGEVVLAGARAGVAAREGDESSKTRSAMSRIPVLLGVKGQSEYFFSFS